MNEEFFTLTNYIHRNNYITYAMEDYLEMIYRKELDKEDINITKLSMVLNVKKSSCSKMISKLKKYKLVDKNKIILTKKGLKIAKYLYYRHEILSSFLKKLNKDKFRLEQVEKIEHFIDHDTLNNLARFI